MPPIGLNEGAAHFGLSSSFFSAFNEQFFGRTMRPVWGKLVKQIIAAVAPESGGNTMAAKSVSFVSLAFA
jgi:hypothetical protein